jgi:hypothetical protein
VRHESFFVDGSSRVRVAGDPGSTVRDRYHWKQPTESKVSTMNDKPKPQPKPEPATPQSQETARQALQQSMDRRW